MYYHLRGSTAIIDVMCGIVITSSLAGLALGYFTRNAVLTYVHKSDERVRALDDSNEEYAPPVYHFQKPVQEPVKPSLDGIVHSDPVKKKYDGTHTPPIDISADQEYDGSTNTIPASFRKQ